MDIIEAMNMRHSVRKYTEEPLPEEVIETVKNEVDICNSEGNLHFQLVTDEPKAFDGFMAHYGNFSGVKIILPL